MAQGTSRAIIEVRDLKTFFRTPHGTARAVDGVSFEIPASGTFALVGESGCGKSALALSLIGLVPAPAGYIAHGEVLLGGREITGLGEREKREIRGNRISMVFQEPMTSLNPVFTVGEQVVEAIRLHQKKSRQEARRAAIEIFRKVRLPEADSLFGEYPHRLSGGMRQRVMIAMALSCRPDLLIADEPTTALDVTIQDEIMTLIREMRAEFGMAVLLITHNMALVYRNSGNVGVMYAGKMVERAPTEALFSSPMHPYTIKLLRSIPGTGKKGGELDTIAGSVPPVTSLPGGCRFASRCPVEMAGCAEVEPLLADRGAGPAGHMVACHLYDAAFMASGMSRPLKGAQDQAPGPEGPAPGTRGLERPIIEVRGLRTHYPVRKGVLKRIRGYVKAVDGIDLAISRGSTLALVGESGCGKTTAGKSIIRLIRPTSGEILFKGEDIAQLGEGGLRRLRSSAQIIFQDPYSSLDPRMTVRETIEEGLKSLKRGMGRREREARVAETLERVGLEAGMMERYPHEFSGGQRQRVGIARALAVEPEFIVCDEAVSALDVSVQAQILNLLKSLQRELGLAYLFITHDLGVVEYMADTVAVMHNGAIVESGTTEEVFSTPRHDYTKRLLAAVPAMDPRLAEAWRLPGR